ncbi:MAG: hypothetical protein LUD47_02720 [Clostridia bacterium]|nr:hypothetical protein [Clostridia bacterium]
MAADLKSEVTNFLNKCDDLKSCRFIVAPTKIRELLQSIAASRELCRFFSDLTKDFDYNTAKTNCFVCVTDGTTRKNRLVISGEVNFRLAFTFCLLVEIDKQIINLNDLLSRYFFVDGSYYSSYQMFVEDVIAPMADIIKQCYSAVLVSNDMSERRVAYIDSGVTNTMSLIETAVAAEKYNIETSQIPPDDRISGDIMLTEIESAVRRSDFKVASTILCGYNYYLQYYGFVSEDFRKLVSLIDEYKGQQQK